MKLLNEQHILITGGLGYIGSVLIPKLLKRGYRVTILDLFRPTKSFCQSFNTVYKPTFINGDILDRATVKKSLEGVTSVLNLAAVSDARKGRLNPDLTIKTNIEGCFNLLDLAKQSGVQKFIQASTFGVYGNKYKQPLTENLPVAPTETYSITKVECENIAKKFNSKSFITACIRFAMVCGWSPEMRFDFIVNTLTYKALTEKTVCVFGGGQRRPQIHIDDAANHLIEMLETPLSPSDDNIFNSYAENISILSIAETIKACMGSRINLEILPERQSEDSFILDYDKISKIINLNSTKSVKMAIQDIIQQYQLY